ncbi:peroxisomal biogenesis factor 19 [Adelges cooleyi]|uniref:peroxisomal biogenesis factor 19 n=1 Tax=Adelges cooleyi TaxID=133065 RepID=UPI00217F7E4E|nr:peroxisomal biogenesis factor 19 [Adelges cooleyi]
MSDNPPAEDNSQNALSELLDDALKDFEEPNQPTSEPVVTDMSAVSSPENFIKENLEETMKSFMNGEQAQMAAELQEIMMADADVDLQSVIQESLKSLSEAKQNLPEGSDLSSMFANMGVGDDLNLDDDVMPMMMQFLQPLFSKDVLYPSIKDLCDKFPQWLEDNKATVEQDEFDRYTKMFDFMKEVRDHLETQNDSDDEITKTRKFKELMELLKKMQECGQPPQELLGDAAGPPMPDSMGQCSIM